MSNRFTAELECVSVVFKSVADSSGGVYRFTALDGVSLSFFAGEIHTILGENGAGKSTLVHVLSGLQLPDAGSIILDGERTVFSSPADALAGGIAMVHQRPLLSDELTVLENASLGSGGLFVNRARKRRSILEKAGDWGIELDPNTPVRDLSPADRLRAALLGALFAEPSLLILDEPTAVLAPRDRNSFMEAVARARDRGLGIILITHKIEEALRWSDRVSVLKKGKIVHSSPMVDESGRPLIDMAALESYLDAPANRVVAIAESRHTARSGLPSFSVEGLSATPANRPPIAGISLTAMPGTITGIFGHPGSGMGTLEDALSGMIRPDSGRVTIRIERERGESVGQGTTTGEQGESSRQEQSTRRLIELNPSNLSPRRLRESGVALVPSNRAFRGSHPDLTIADCLLAYRSGVFIMDRERDAAFVRSILEREGIPATPERLARTLSGGQLQRCILARELESRPAIMILTEPEWGLDIRSAALLRERLAEAARSGMTILILTDTPDTMAIGGFYSTTMFLREGRLS